MHLSNDHTCSYGHTHQLITKMIVKIYQLIVAVIMW